MTTTIPIAQLKHIIEKCESSGWGNTCGNVSEYISGALMNNWGEETLSNPGIEEFYNPYWVNRAFSGENVDIALVDEICQAADKYPFITVDVSTCSLDHCFVVCNTDQGRVRVDAYFAAYSVTYQDIDLRETLLLIVNDLSPETWNKIFGTVHDNMDIGRENLCLEYSFCDETVEGIVYHNRERMV